MSADLQLHLVVSLLRRGRRLDELSTVLTLVALAYGLAPLLGTASSLAASLLCVLLVLLGLLQKYWALRVALDAELFERLAASTNTAQGYRDLDQALANLSLGGKTERSEAQRCRGALGLLRLQLCCLCGQIGLALMAILAMPWLHLN